MCPVFVHGAEWRANSAQGRSLAADRGARVEDMKHKGSHRDPQQFLNDVRARQRNTVWPDTFRNGRAVDAFLWRGSPDATPVQRVGTGLFGLAFLAMAVAFFILARQVGSRLVGVLAFGFAFLGVRLCRNALLRHKKADPKTDTPWQL